MYSTQAHHVPITLYIGQLRKGGEVRHLLLTV
eukprot:SAG31_NODE_35927_length_318_cov_0.739726_1_plen_31_part_01